MIIDMRIYKYAPSGFVSFLNRYRETGFDITSRHLGTTIAILTSASGTANRTLQLFAYRDADHRDECRAKLRSDPAWLAYIREVSQYIVEQTNTILRPTDFSALRTFDQLADRAWLNSGNADPMLIELRSYIAHPGSLGQALGLLGNEEAVLAPQFVERPIGYFTSETGPANQVFMLSGYANDGERDRRCARMRQDTRFQDLAARIDPLCARQERDVWNATAYSPLR